MGGPQPLDLAQPVRFAVLATGALVDAAEHAVTGAARQQPQAQQQLSAAPMASSEGLEVSPDVHHAASKAAKKASKQKAKQRREAPAAGHDQPDALQGDQLGGSSGSYVHNSGAWTGRGNKDRDRPSDLPSSSLSVRTG